MQIVVKYAIDSDPLTLEVSPLDTTGHVKLMLRSFTPKIFSGQDLLVCSDAGDDNYTPMDDSLTIGSIQQDGDRALFFWFCGSGSFSIGVYDFYVSGPEGRRQNFSLKVDSFVKVGAIKALIERNTCQAPVDQRLVHYGRLLDDDSKPLLFYDIVKPFGNMMTPLLVLQDADKIFPDEEPLTPEIPSDAEIHYSRSTSGRAFREAVQGIQAQAAADPLPADHRQKTVPIHVYGIKIKFYLYIELLASSTIDQLKSIISRRADAPANSFVLLLNGTPLIDDDGNCTLEQSGFKEEHNFCEGYFNLPAIIKVRLPSPLDPLSCAWSLPEFTIKVNPLQTLGQTKEKINKKTGIPPQEQCLKFCGQRIDGGGDERLLLTYVGIPSGSPSFSILLIPQPLNNPSTSTAGNEAICSTAARSSSDSGGVLTRAAAKKLASRNVQVPGKPICVGI